MTLYNFGLLLLLSEVLPALMLIGIGIIYWISDHKSNTDGTMAAMIFGIFGGILCAALAAFLLSGVAS